MRESIWGTFITIFGIMCLFLIFFFQSLTNTDEHNYTMLKETTEAAMVDSLDLAAYRSERIIRIDREKFVENFLRRFAESASLSNSYIISIYDVNELPPKVSLKVASKVGGTITDASMNGTYYNFDIVNRLDAILETPY